MAELIFITGATGFIGSLAAKKALENGYRVRISVRKEAQIEKVKAILKDFEDKIEFVIVSDITDSKAFAGKLEGVDYVFHIASPLPGGIDKTAFFGPAVNGTTAILSEAAKVPSIKKVVITSSVAAWIPRSGPNAGKLSSMYLLTSSTIQRMIFKTNEHNSQAPDDPYLVIDTEADFSGKTNFETSFNLYHVSKILSNQASWKFMKENSPKFILITLHPNFVYGHSLTQTSAEEAAGSTNGLLWGAIMAEDKATNLSYVAVGDVAEAHVRALKPEVKESTSYLVSGPAHSWDDVLEIVKSDYPGVAYKLKSGVPTNNFTGSTEKTEKELSIKWTSLKDVVHEVMDQQLGFMAQASKI